METCEFCGKMIDYVNRDCDGVQTLTPDPYQEEINGDNTEVWLCPGAYYESSMDI